MIKVYEYKNCGTCKKALKYLDTKNIPYEVVAIREKPPSKSELKTMLNFYNGESKRLFNTSGGDYKELNLKAKLPSMSIEDQIDLLSKNGNLVKRPFVISKDFGLVGFKEEEWGQHF